MIMILKHTSCANNRHHIVKAKVMTWNPIVLFRDEWDAFWHLVVVFIWSKLLHQCHPMRFRLLFFNNQKYLHIYYIHMFSKVHFKHLTAAFVMTVSAWIFSNFSLLCWHQVCIYKERPVIQAHTLQIRSILS